MFSLNDSFSEILAGTILGQAVSALAGFWIFLFIFGAALFVLKYFVHCYPQHAIAGKVGIDKTWMSYLPVARAIQKTEIADMPAWKSIFLGFFNPFVIVMAIIFLFGSLFGEVVPTFAGVMMILLSITVYALAIVFNYQYNHRLCKIFGFNTILAFFMLFFPFFKNVFFFMVVFPGQIRANKECLYGAEHTVFYTDEPKDKNDYQDNRNYNNYNNYNFSPALIGRHGAYVGQRLDFNSGEAILLGRDRLRCSVVFPETCAKISRTHCSVSYDPTRNTYVITDMSSNGTYVNNERIPQNTPYMASSGSILKLGNADNSFTLA